MAKASAMILRDLAGNCFSSRLSIWTYEHMLLPAVICWCLKYVLPAPSHSTWGCRCNFQVHSSVLPTGSMSPSEHPETVHYHFNGNISQVECEVGKNKATFKGHEGKALQNKTTYSSKERQLSDWRMLPPPLGGGFKYGSELDLCWEGRRKKSERY